MSVRVTFLALLVACLVGIAFSIKCYDCNTLDKNCNNDKVKDTKILLKDCFGQQSCRVILQKVEDETRIIRQCSNVTRAEDMGCTERLGTSKVKVRYCHCKGDGCNSALPLTSSLGLAAFLAVLAKLLV